MRILITGGCGFIGSALCRRLVGESGHTVVNLDKLTYAGTVESVAEIANDPRYELVVGDVTDREFVASVLAEHEPDAVVHLAAESHVDRSISDPMAFVKTNVLGTGVMLHEATAYRDRLKGDRRDRFRFLHISTDEVFGSLESAGRFSETTAYDPSSPYSSSKAGADHLVAAWHRTYGLPTLLTNCSNNYGPYQFPEKLIPLMILNALDGKPLPVYGSGQNVRDWLFVDDHVRALEAVLLNGRPGEKYMVGGLSERTNMNVVEAICDLIDEYAPNGGTSRRALIRHVDDRPGHDKRYAVDPAKIERDIGWRPSETFESGLAKTVRWYLDRRDWWEPIRSRVYGGQRLGLIGAAAK